MKVSAVVKTQQGSLQGALLQSIYIFKGVPYAQPPLGDLRWQPPQPPSKWQGVKEALDYSSSPPQNPGKADRFKEFVVEGPQSEDCLYLNIWSPGLDEAKRPVMVWIHGGVFSLGSGSQNVFEGTVLAKNQNVVVVTLNYRLGLLGFLNLNQVTDGLIPSSGNEGLLDQIAALKWIRANIIAFGGNPANITLFGESAGASSVKCLLNMPAASGLFHKAILQSPMKTEMELAQAKRNALQFLETASAAGWSPPKLRQMPVGTILSLQQQLEKSNQSFAIAPVIDGIVLPTNPQVGIQKGNSSDIPLLIGTNAEEMRLFHFLRSAKSPDDNQLKTRIGKLTSPASAEVIINTYRQYLYPRRWASNEEVLIAVESDLNFRLPVVNLLESRCPIANSTFAYLFDWQSPALENKLGACHAMEVGFIFGNYDADFCGVGGPASKLSAQMRSAWAAFACAGNPACSPIGEWPSYCQERSTLVLGSQTHVETSPFEEIRKMWNQLPSSF